MSNNQIPVSDVVRQVQKIKNMNDMILDTSSSFYLIDLESTKVEVANWIEDLVTF